jgi:hypothetical protein
MYIGKTPTVGNFQVCDAISVVNGQAAYTLQVGGTNVAPESANHMLVSLNGILQKPGSSFTISGSTMTFASNLATGDVIDFVQILGNVLDIGQPSDDTVTNAKLAQDIISGETDIGGALADADLVLVDDGAGGTLRKSAMSRIKTYVDAESNTPSFFGRGSGATAVTNATLVRIAARDEIVDNGSCYNNTGSSTTLNSLTAPADAFTPNVAGLYFFTGAVQLNTTNFQVGLVNNLGSTGGSESYASLVYRKSDTANGMVMVSGFSNMNGTGNNMSLTCYQESGGTINTNDSFYTTYFGGFLVKAT